MHENTVTSNFRRREVRLQIVQSAVAIDSPNPTMAEKRYRAFISYSQKDKAAGRRVQRWLETYRVPKGIDAAGNRRLGRFFRDDEEMSASPDVGATLRGAIEDSDNLIVIASP